jgi:hypothetical protein
LRNLGLIEASIGIKQAVPLTAKSVASVDWTWRNALGNGGGSGRQPGIMRSDVIAKQGQRLCSTLVHFDLFAQKVLKAPVATILCPK